LCVRRLDCEVTSYILASELNAVQSERVDDDSSQVAWFVQLRKAIYFVHFVGKYVVSGPTADARISATRNLAAKFNVNNRAREVGGLLTEAGPS